MSQMMQIDQICALAETYTKQLEALAYSKNAAMGVRLSASIDTAILIGGISSDNWNRRVQIAMNNLMLDRPSTQALADNIPAAVAGAVTLPPPAGVPHGQPVSLHVVPTPKI